MVLPVELYIYTPERKAEFLLDNAVTGEDYAWAVEEVKGLGLDPALIPPPSPHERPKTQPRTACSVHKPGVLEPIRTYERPAASGIFHSS
jgi:hypothetical protein